MANLLTGDYEAVLQVSEATLNRLMASMHQNAWKDVNTPSFPHSAGVRVGAQGVVDGVQGRAFAQVAVPRFHLIDFSTDAFEIEVSLRVRYLPDDGSTPLPTYSEGKLRARYQVTDIDPNCLGWGKVANQYLWFRVVPDSVSFTGTYGEDTLLAFGLIDVDEANAAMTKQLAHVLVTEFEPMPHWLAPRFRQRLFKSRVEPDGLVSEAPLPGLNWVPDVPVGGSAVLVPLGVYQDPPAGALGSLEHVLLRGRDFAVAINQSVLTAAMQPALDAIQNYTARTKVTTTTDYGLWEDTDVYYYDTTINAGSVNAAWLPNDTYARILITAKGHSHCDDWLKPDFDFTVTQPLHLEFDPGSESLVLWAESGTIDVETSSGVPLPWFIWDDITPEVRNQVQGAVNNAVTGAQSTLAGFSTGAAELKGQLTKMDGNADAHFDQASFYLSGVVFRGRISVSRRRKPEVDFQKIDGDTLSAFQAWIPGGRIDSFRWTWSWNASWRAADQGEETLPDRYVLKRPPSGGKTRYGMAVRGDPLPGLDGNGKVCLSLKGVVVNPATGQFDPVETTVSCRRWGFVGPFRRDAGRIYVPEYEVGRRPGPHPPGPVEVGVVDITAHSPHDTGSANTLVVSVGDSFSEQLARTVVDGLAGCTREDAGLLVAVVFSEGALNGRDGDHVRALRAFGDRLEAPLIVNEDVAGSWASALSFNPDNGEVAWRLLSPGGGMLWARDGELSSDQLASALDACLYPSPPASPSAVQVEREWSPDELVALVGDIHVHPIEDVGPACPSTFTVRPSDIGLVVSSVAFVNKSTASSSSEMERLRAANAGRGANDPPVVVVLDDADDSEARRLGDELGPAFTVVADPDGSVAARAGIRFWPTTVAVDGKEGVRS